MRSEVQRAADAGTATWWLNAVLAHTQSLDDGLDHLTGDVVGLNGQGHRQSWSSAVGALRTSSVTAVRLAIVEPGDPVGIPGPALVTQAAVNSGVALVSDSSALTLIPDPVTGVWRALASTASATPRPLGTLSESRSLLREAMHELTTAFPTLEPDETALAGLAQFRQFAGPVPPQGISLRAREVATDALRVWWLSGLARELSERRGVTVPPSLRHLRAGARRAAAVAFSEPPRL